MRHLTSEGTGAPYIDNKPIPLELRKLKQWVNWTGSKVPLHPRTLNSASSTDPATWGTFKRALANVEQGRADGIGFMFTEDDPYVGIDLDKCRDPETGVLEEWAEQIVQRFNSYTEVSISGTGVHICVRGVLSGKGRNTPRGEMYDRNRYFTFTGNRVDGTPSDINERAEEVDILYEELGPDASGGLTSATQPMTPPGSCLEDDEVIDRACVSKG